MPASFFNGTVFRALRHQSRPQAPLRRPYSTRYSYDSGGTFRSARSSGRMIIALNTAVFGLWTYASYNDDRRLWSWLQRNFVLNKTGIDQGHWHTLVTSAFSHQQLGHFAFNMIALNSFVTILSFAGVGGFAVLQILIGSGIAGSAAVLVHEASRAQGTFAPERRTKNYIGASGMVTGAGVAATYLMPRAPMNLMFIPIAIPLWAITGLYLALDLYYLDAGTRTAHGGHLGGAAFGMIYAALLL